MTENDQRTPEDHSTRLVRLGAILLLSTLAMVAARAPLTVANIPHTGEPLFPDDYLGVIMALVNALVGFLIVRYQPRLSIGWLFMALAVPLAVSDLARAYAIYGLIAAPGSGTPGLEFAAWLQNWLDYLAFPIPFAMLFMLFPDGRLPSPRWRWAFGIALGSLLLQVLQQILRPGSITIYVSDRALALPVMNPTGMRSLADMTPVLENIWLISMFVLLVGAISLLARYRGADWVERQQLKWLVLFLILLLILLPFAFRDWEDNVLDDIGLILLILMLPVGTAIAILRYNLYGIDVIIRRTVQYTLLTGILAVVYFSLVLFLQTLFTGLSAERSPFVLVISTLAIAALFNPLRLRILAFIDRRFFRSSYDAEKSLSDFAVAIRSEVALEQLAAALLGLVQQTMQPDRASLWLQQEKPAKGRSPQ